MTHLNHINLSVPDVAETKQFFETYFNFTCTEVKGDNIVAVLRGSDNFLLILSNFGKGETPQYPVDFHIGFIMDNEEQVQEIHENLKAGGIQLEREPRKIRDSMGFYFTGPGGFMIEVSCPIQQ